MIYQASKSSDSIVATEKSAIESPKLLNEYALYIPRAYARGESNKLVSHDEVSKIPHSTLYIERQIGRSYTRKPTYVYWELPKTKRLVAIVLYPDGGVEFKKDEHKFIIRETDELDRRIILGFCKKYQSSLKDECHRDADVEPNWHLWAKAELYNASKMPKRIKTGKGSGDLTWFYKNMLEPYEECGIFSNLQFI